MPLFNDADRDALNRLTYDEAAKPSFELIKSCLTWLDDELPRTISNDGYSALCDVWSVRGFIHCQRPLESWGLTSSYYQDVLYRAIHEIPDWPGFRRFGLSASDRRYLEEELHHAATDEIY
jgi:hypothetical protein